MKSVKDYIISIPDFPSKGIIFRDVTSVLESPEGYALAIDELNKLLDGVDYDLIAGTESRGFIFGAPLAYMNKKGFIPVRKKGKLPRKQMLSKYAKTGSRKVISSIKLLLNLSLERYALAISWY